MLRVVMAFVLVVGCMPGVCLVSAEMAYGRQAETLNLHVQGKDGDDDKQDGKDAKAAEAVEKLIEALPSAANAKASDEDKVKAAKKAYDELTDAQRKLVDRKAVERLDAVEKAVKQKVEDKKAADAVSSLIQALPDSSAATTGDKAAAQAAHDAFSKLTADQKKGVTAADQQKLEAVLAAVAAAEQAERERQQSGGSQSSGEPPAGGGAGSGSSTPSDSKHYVNALFLKWDKPDEFGERHFVGDGPIVEDAYKTIGVVEFGETVQLTGWYTSTDGTGVVYQTADSATGIGSFNLTWKSSDETVATVSPAGLVTPRGKNGEVSITATVADEGVYEGAAPTASVTISFDGQEGRYVKQIDILDAQGNVIGERWGGVTQYEEANAFYQLHARVTWRNVVTGEETVTETGSGDDYSAKAVGTVVTWNVSVSSAFTINADTGRLRTGKYSGNAYVTCSAVGGLGGMDAVDTANVQLDTGTYEYNPSGSLGLKVVYEERPDEVVAEASYTYEELLKKLSTRHVDATVVSSSRFGVISADGFLFKDIVDLVAVDDADVLQYRFATSDGYDNPVSHKYLFDSGPRYYFPNYDLGGSHADGEIVPPVLAYRSAMEWNESQANPSAKLDDGNRFRLVFGCLASGDSNTSFQIYYINAVTVVLKGAPPAGGEEGSGEGGEGGKGTSGGSAGRGDTSGEAGVRGNRDGNRANGGAAAGDPGEGQEGSGSSSENGQGGDEERESQESKPDEAHPADADAEGADLNSPKRWRVYQMMSKSNSDVPDWNDENPISPFAAPIAVGAFVAGAGATGIGFRRRLR